MDEDAKCGVGCGLEPSGCINCAMEEGSPEELTDYHFIVDNDYLDYMEEDEWD